MKVGRTFSFLVCMCMIFIIGTNCSAERISVYDSTVDSFCETYNSIVRSSSDKISILIDNANMQKKNVNFGTLIFYPLRNCVNGNGTHIVLIMNPANNIFEINIDNNMFATRDDTKCAYETVLKVLGASIEDIQHLSDLSEPRTRFISNKKNIVTGFRPANAQIGFDSYIIAAFDR